MKRFIDNWKKILVFAIIYAAISTIVLVFLSMETTQIAQIVIVSTIITTVLVTYAGIFQRKE